MTSSGRTFFLTLVATVVVGLTSILAWSLKWSAWSWLMLVVVLLGLAVPADRYLARGGRRSSTAAVIPTAQPVYEPAVRQERTLSEVPLPSAVPDYVFYLSATVCWRVFPDPPGVPNADPGALAVDTIVARARHVAASRQPGEYALVQHRLGGELSAVLPDDAKQLEAWATNVTLSLTDADLARLHKLADVRKDEDVWEHERNYERNKRAYLGDDVLKDPGSAVVWWLSRKDDDLDRAMRSISPLTELAAAANNQTAHVNGVESPRFVESENGALRPSAEPVVPERTAADHVADLIGTLGLGHGDPKFRTFVDRLAKTIEAAGCQSAADDVRQRFTSRDDTASDSGEDDEPGSIHYV